MKLKLFVLFIASVAFLTGGMVAGYWYGRRSAPPPVPILELRIDSRNRPLLATMFIYDAVAGRVKHGDEYEWQWHEEPIPYVETFKRTLYDRGTISLFEASPGPLREPTVDATRGEAATRIITSTRQ